MRRTLLVVGSVAALAAVGGLALFVTSVPTTTTDCGLGTGGVDPIAAGDGAVETPSEARRALRASLNGSNGDDLRASMRANLSSYERVDLADAFEADIANAADEEWFDGSERTYYFTVDGRRQADSALGVTESGVVFSASYGSC